MAWPLPGLQQQTLIQADRKIMCLLIYPCRYEYHLVHTQNPNISAVFLPIIIVFAVINIKVGENEMMVSVWLHVAAVTRHTSHSVSRGVTTASPRSVTPHTWSHGDQHQVHQVHPLPLQPPLHRK